MNEYPVRADLERFAGRAVDAARRGSFSETHNILLLAKSWLSSNEPTAEEVGFWLGVLAATAGGSRDSAVNELLQRYHKEWLGYLKSLVPPEELG